MLHLAREPEQLGYNSPMKYSCVVHRPAEQNRLADVMEEVKRSVTDFDCPLHSEEWSYAIVQSACLDEPHKMWNLFMWYSLEL
jgi:hypothetical protein